jgi:hypothetical protein
MTIDTPEMQAILQRIERLEAENRRLKRLGVLALVLLGAIFLMAQTPRAPKSVEANSFVLHDADGRIRARLAFCASSPCLTLLDANEHAVTTLDGAGLKTQMLVLNDLKGKAWGVLANYATLKTKVGGGPSLSLFGPNGENQAELRIEPDGPTLAFSDTDGKRLLVARVFRGSPHFWLADHGEMPRLALSLSGSEPSITVSDAEGFETKIGTTDLVTTRTGETNKTSAASLVLFGKDNKVLWRAP